MQSNKQGRLVLDTKMRTALVEVIKVRLCVHATSKRILGRSVSPMLVVKCVISCIISNVADLQSITAPRYIWNSAVVSEFE